MTYSPNGFNKFTGSSKAIGSNFQNASGSTVTKGTPVTLNLSGQAVLIDVSDQASVQAILGVASLDLPNGSNGGIVDAGRLENITTGFAIRDVVYVGKNGLLTNVAPDIGVGSFVAGDFVILVGVIVKNEFNAMQKDLKLMIDVVGQL